MRKSLFTLLSFLLPLFMSALEITAPTPYYLMHSSGCHLAKDADGRAVLESAQAQNPQMLTFTPLEGGYYNISAPDGSVLSLDGNWNASFLDDATSKKAHYAIEKAGKSFIKLKCRSNSKYLGTDQTIAGARAYSDKSGADTRHYWFLSTDPTAIPEIEEVSYVINPAAERQIHDGWGVSLCWWANMCGKWSDDKIDEIVDWLVSPDGLNFRIFRYNIGGGDDPNNTNCTEHHMGGGKGLRAEMEGFKDSSDGEYIWTRDAAQRKIMLKIKERRPDAIFEAFSNSCPYYMTYSGCVAGNTSASKDNLKPEYYEEFAHYLVDVCKHYKDEYGIEFRTLDPFNEPMTNYWGANGGQEGCHFDVNSMIEFVKVLHPILKESGLNTVISATDETSVEQSVKDFIAFREAGILDMIGQWNVHTYTANDHARTQISALCKEENMPLWMSEVGAGGSGISGNINLAQKLMNDIRYIMPSAWIDWQYIEEGNDQWCLVKADSFADGKYHKVKNYSIRSHFSRYIKEGYTFVTTLNGQALAAHSPEDDELVIVVINPGATSIRHSIDLSMYDSVDANFDAIITTEDLDMADFDAATLKDGKLSFELPALSIATFVIPVVKGDKADCDFIAGRDYLVCSRQTAGLALTAVDGGVKIKTIDFDNAQIWTVNASGDGFTFSNKNGDIITADTAAYVLKTLPEVADGQLFHIDPIDDIFYKISNVDHSKAFDLEGVGTADGTNVGLWAYDDNAPTHRQWSFFYIPEGSDLGAVMTPVSDETVAPIRISNPATATLKIDRLSDSADTLRIYTPSGSCIYQRPLIATSLLIPLTSGFYIVCFSNFAKAIFVK